MTTYSTQPLPPIGDPIRSAPAELSHASIGQWGAVIAGALAGFGVTIVLTTLGTALGMTAAPTDPAALGEASAEAMGGGAIAWALITALLVGAVGGIVLARSARPDRSFHPVTLGLVTWTGGLVLALLVAAPAASALVGSLGSGAAAVAAQQVDRPLARDAGAPADLERNARPAEASLRTDLTEAERARFREMAQDTARAAIIAAWTALLAQLLSLGATVIAAKAQRRRLVDVEPTAYAIPARATA